MDYHFGISRNEDYLSDGNSFESLSIEFEKTVKEISCDSCSSDLQPYLKEYQKLFKTILKSRENEKRLFRKSEELQQQIISLTQYIREDIKQKKDDVVMKESLENDVKEVWEKVRGSHLKETKQKDLMKQFQREINVLQKLLEHGLNIRTSSQQRIKILQEKRDALMKKIGDYDDEVNKLIKEISFQKEHVLEVEKKNHSLEEDLKEVVGGIEENVRAFSEQEKGRQEGERGLSDTRVSIQEKNEEMKRVRRKIEQVSVLTRRLTQEINSEMGRLSRLQEIVGELNGKKVSLEEHLQKQKHLTEHLLKNTVALKEENEHWEEEVRRIDQQRDTLKGLLGDTRENVHSLEQKKRAIEDKKANMEGRIRQNQRSLVELKHQYEKGKNMKEEKAHQRQVLAKMTKTQSLANDRQVSGMAVQKGRKMNLLRKKKAFRNASEVRRKEIYVVQKEVMRYAKQCEETRGKIQNAELEIDHQKEKEKVFVKRVGELRERIRLHRDLCAKVRQDAEDYQRQQQTKTVQIEERRREFKYIQKMIHQTKEEMKNTDRKIQNQYVELETGKEQTEFYRKMVDQRKEHIEANRKMKQRKEAEILKLEKILAETETERCGQIKEIESVTNDRDVLSRQLIRRNEELGKVHERIQLQQNEINLAKRKFDDVLLNIQMLTDRRTQLEEKRMQLEGELSILPGYKRDVLSLQKQLRSLQNKQKALQDEMKTHLNVHRWRKLEGSKPGLFRMIQKFHKLQKQFIKKNDQITEKNRMIQMKEKMYIEFRKQVLKQPSPEVVEQFNLYQMVLAKKQRQLKQLKHSLKKASRGMKQKEAEYMHHEREFLQLKQQYFSNKVNMYKPPKEAPFIGFDEEEE